MSNNKQHAYTVQLEWTGNLGFGTNGYKTFSRDHLVSAVGKASISGSSGPAFRGDAKRYNPEELLISALASSHMLWYLHLCVGEQIIVTNYTDEGTGVLVETGDGSGHLAEIVLRPKVTIESGCDILMAQSLHEKARELCYIANSVNFPVRCIPSVVVERVPLSNVA